MDQTLQTLATWTGTARAACSTTGTTRPPARAHRLAAGRQRRPPVPVHCGQRLARRRADGGPRGPSRDCAAGGRPARRRWTSASSTTRPRPTTASAGLIRGGFWDADPAGCSVVDNYRHRGPDVWYTCNYYDTRVTEARIALYLGIARGQIPAKPTSRTAHLPGHLRLVLAGAAAGRRAPRTYLGVAVFEGAYRYRGHAARAQLGRRHVRGADARPVRARGGLGPRSWGRQPPADRRAQIEHGLDDAKYGYWGFSPASEPGRRLLDYGVEAIGMNPDGYSSDEETTELRRRLRRLPPGHQPDPDVRRRRGHPARGLPRPAVRARHGARQPGQLKARLRRVRRRWLLRRGRGASPDGGPARTCRSTRRW